MLFTRYPFKLKRKTIKDYFGGAPAKSDLFKTLPEMVKHMNPDTAEIYRFTDTLRSEGIGSEDFYHMLINAGASATKEWVANHYKLIVWKLACLERDYQAKAGGKLLTPLNVLEELKYRYDREFNYGHRSALKKILDGDASPATMMVLCVSYIYPPSMLPTSKLNDETEGIEETHKLSSHASQIELTDGWYTVDANLDGPLSKQLTGGKIFVGQKLRIWGASLCGWSEPISPIEDSKSVSLQLHVNGTYRAHWSDSLGFCKYPGAPLAFRCINGAGGKIPKTLVGITKIYPVLYRERYPDGVSAVRSEHMEMKVLQLYNQRRANIAEGIATEQIDLSINYSDSEEGAQILKKLETSAEPEALMADLSAEQLLSITTYKSKLEDIRQSKTVKKIEKACEEAGLSSRDVTPFMRVRVVGLTSKGSCRRSPPKEGMITIWNPTERQKNDLMEGQIYSVTGLTPQNFGSDILYLHAKGSSTIWKPMLISMEFEPFYDPRKVVSLSNLGEVPLASEFDMAAVVVHVGEAYTSGTQKKQWVFVTDGSKCRSEIEIEDIYDCLLAVSFSIPAKDDISGLLSQYLPGTTVCNCQSISLNLGL